MSSSTKLISYDLMAPGKDYSELYKYLKSFPTHHKIQESFWMVNSDKEAETIRDEIKKHVDGNDRIFVVSYGSDSSSAWTSSIEKFKADLIHEQG